MAFAANGFPVSTTALWSTVTGLAACKRKGSDKKEEGSDKKEEGSDRKEEGSDKKEEGSDKKEKGSDKKEKGSDKKEEGHVESVYRQAIGFYETWGIKSLFP
jgi:hypothetical protein